jgi:formamidopyrimidine-DNA glycosylase
MPELPEVETIRRGLEAVLVGRVVTGVDVRVPKIFTGEPDNIIGQSVDSLERFGKLLAIRFSNEYVLTVHLKMTGQLIFKDGEAEAVMGGHPEKSYLESLPHKHTHVIVSFENDAKLFFNDLRKFGYMQVLPGGEVEGLEFVQKLGPEPLEKEFTREYLISGLGSRPRSAIKSFLLDQTNIAGLGNIYADESLFRAAILPTRLAGSLTRGEASNLFDAIQETLELALLYGGSSERDYLTATGDKGTFLKIANVYHRTGQGCNRCHAGIIERVKIGGRSSHFCPVCQT